MISAGELPSGLVEHAAERFRQRDRRIPGADPDLRLVLEEGGDRFDSLALGFASLPGPDHHDRGVRAWAHDRLSHRPRSLVCEGGESIGVILGGGPRPHPGYCASLDGHRLAIGRTPTYTCIRVHEVETGPVEGLLVGDEADGVACATMVATGEGTPERRSSAWRTQHPGRIDGARLCWAQTSTTAQMLTRPRIVTARVAR
jgi:hypothetical protein